MNRALDRLGTLPQPVQMACTDLSLFGGRCDEVTMLCSLLPA